MRFERHSLAIRARIVKVLKKGGKWTRFGLATCILQVDHSPAPAAASALLSCSNFRSHS